MATLHPSEASVDALAGFLIESASVADPEGPKSMDDLSPIQQHIIRTQALAMLMSAMDLVSVDVLLFASRHPEALDLAPGTGRAIATDLEIASFKMPDTIPEGWADQ